VKLSKLVIQNFLSVQNATLYLADKGLVSIEGINEDATGSDSNGCGKSTIINAILWCNYGSYGKDGGVDDVVNSKAGKGCFVLSEWREDSRVYLISRYRSHPKYKHSVKVELNGMDITKAGAKAVQQQINEILGANETVFRASCFAQQENPLDIPALTDSKLKELLENVLPIEDLSALHKRATEEVVQQEKLVDKYKQELDLKTWQIDHNKQELKEALAARMKHIDEVDAKNAEIDKQIKFKNVARGIALGFSNKHDLERELHDLINEETEIGDSDYMFASYKHNEYEKLVDALKYQLDHPVNTCAECGQETEDLEKVKARIKYKLFEAEEERDKLRDKAKVVSHNYARRNHIKTKISAIEKQLIECDRNKEAADRLEAEISLLQGQKTTAGENPHTATVTRLRGFLKDAIAGHKDYTAKLKEASERLELLKAVQLAYSPKGLRYHILEKVAPQLTTATNKYLSTLTDGAIQAVWSTVSKTASGDYKEKFSIEAKMEGRSSFALLSGGEKRKVRLACFFALQDLIASQASKHIELWCGDEIDVALDPAGMERLMGLLAEKAETKSTILVISHNKMREWIPNYATVTRKDGISTITGYLNVD
jgi:DNA repair exonuclease SbcCD ATPase subunit